MSETPERQVTGWELIDYANRRNFAETVLKIKEVLTREQMGGAALALEPGTLILTFHQIEDPYVLNPTSLARLTGAFSPRPTYWPGNFVRIVPVEQKDFLGAVVGWSLELEPLWRCKQCNREFSSDQTDQTCPWCLIEGRDSADREKARAGTWLSDSPLTQEEQ